LFHQRTYVLLASRDEYGLPSGNRRLQFRQPVQNAPHAFDGPNPFAGLLWVGPALLEILWLVAHTLKEHVALLIVVGIRDKDAGLLHKWSPFGMVHERISVCAGKA
jgi:hypothetical protein